MHPREWLTEQLTNWATEQLPNLTLQKCISRQIRVVTAAERQMIPQNGRQARSLSDNDNIFPLFLAFEYDKQWRRGSDSFWIEDCSGSPSFIIAFDIFALCFAYFFTIIFPFSITDRPGLGFSRNHTSKSHVHMRVRFVGGRKVRRLINQVPQTLRMSPSSAA